jgi:hypothetical protein
MATNPTTSLGPSNFDSVIAVHSGLAAVVGKIPELRALVEEIFAAPVTVEVEEDHEIADKWYFVLTVTTAESHEKISEHRHQWYRRSYPILKDQCEFVVLDVNVTA